MDKSTEGIAFDAVRADELARLGKGKNDDLMGLALSGGGIRSAIFNLGLLQALARLGVLKEFEYLSTVSGGGYIGSWLSAWVSRVGSIEQVEKSLSSETEPREVRFLREYSNYLTPRLGWLSADTLTGVTTYLRNMLLNLTMIVAVTAVVLLVPWLLGALARALPSHSGLAFATLAVSVTGLAVAVTAITRNIIWQEIEEHRAQAGKPRSETPVSMEPRTVNLQIVLPLVVWAGGLGLLLAADRSLMKGAMFAAVLIAACAAFAIARTLHRLYATLHYPAVGRLDPLRRAFAVAVGTLLGIALMGLFAQALPENHAGWHAVVWGAPVILGIFLLAISFMLGLGGRIESEYAREWWSRLAGLLVRVALIWFAITAASVYGPLLLILLREWLSGVGAAWIVTTLGSVFAARSSTSGKEGAVHKKARWAELLAKIGPYVFIAGLLLAVSTVLFHSARAYLGLPLDRYGEALEKVTQPEWIAGAALLLTLIALVLSLTVDINLFSFHMFYRNRLVRCFLGASNPKRSELPFIGFDPRDNPKLAELAARPYHLINTALNLTSSKRLGWQERKAGAFVLSPLYCGYQFPPGPTATHAPCYQRTEDFVKAGRGYLNLGTALAISGAAASPNMGYHSSPSVAFLLTVFNVRLGWWIQNPSRPEYWERPGPRRALKYLLWELFGITNELTPFVYVSDGGHFDNLGLYELVRRRCRFIVVSDASCDGKFQFEDLGNAIRKCEVDFNCMIKIRTRSIAPEAGTGRSRYHCAVGTIRYRAEDGEPPPAPGYLLYIKSSLSGDEPSDVLQYAASSPDFPHESTQDQWFSESQFESYRKLGFHIGYTALRDAGVTSADDREAMFVALSERWYPPASAGGSAFARHGAELKLLEGALRSDPSLRFLDAQLYPEWEELMRGAKPPAPAGLWLPEGYEERRAGFHFCNNMLQLMENVYVELDLESEHRHPDHRGWMNLFQHWSWSAMFRVTYAVCCSMYGARFQRFCERRLHLDTGALIVSAYPGVAAAGTDLNPVEQEIIARLQPDGARPGVRFDQVHVFEMQIAGPMQFGAEKHPAQAFTYPFGFALTRDKAILYFRIQDHIRRMSHGRRALGRLYHRDGFRTSSVSELEQIEERIDWLEPQDFAAFERLFRSVSHLKNGSL